MRMKLKFLLPVLLVASSAIAQNETSKASGLPSSKWSIFVIASMNANNSFQSNAFDFAENLKPEGLTPDDLKQNIHPNLNGDDYYLTKSSSSPRFGLEYRLNEGTKKKNLNWSFRSDFQIVGINYARQQFGKRNQSALDSAFVPSMNTTVWRDSIYINEYFAQISQRSFIWNNSLLLRFVENRQLSWYAGLQFGFQLNHSRKFQVSQYDYAILDAYTGDSRKTNREVATEFLEPDNSTLRESKLANTISFQLAIPIGLDLRIGDGYFWKHVHPFLEGSLGMNFMKNNANFNFYQNIGVRYKF